MAEYKGRTRRKFEDIWPDDENITQMGSVDTPPSKKPNIDTAAAGNDGGGGISGGPGGRPIPMAMDQHLAQIDRYRVKFAGITYVPTAHNGTTTNNWYRFPWEHYFGVMGDTERIEIAEKWRYWKAIRIKICFKNPKNISEINTTNLTTMPGMDNQSHLFAYRDDLYIAGVYSNPGQLAFGTGGHTINTIRDLVESWGNSGMKRDGSGPASLGGANIPQ